MSQPARDKLFKALQADPIALRETVDLLLQLPNGADIAKAAVERRKKQDAAGNRKPMMFGYGRVSTPAKQEQQKNGYVQSESVERQHEQVKKFFDHRGSELGLIWGGFHSDEAISGGKSFSARPSGSKLARAVSSGDHIVFAKLDRGFRNLHDLMNHVNAWKQRGIVVHFLDINFDTSSLVGEMMLTMLGAFAEFERRRCGERLRAAHARRRELRGGPAPQYKAYWWQLARRKDGKVSFILNPQSGAECAMVAELHRRGWTKGDIASYAVNCKIGRVGKFGKVILDDNHDQLRKMLNIYEKFPHECDAALAARPELMAQWPDQIVPSNESRKLTFQVPTSTRRLTLEHARSTRPTDIELI